MHRRNVLIVAISLGLGLGVAGVPEVLSQMPDVLKNIFGSPITIGAFSAILLNFFLPDEAHAVEEEDYDPEAHMHTVVHGASDEDGEPGTPSSDLTPSPRPN
ncbi:Xanthine permease XanP [compost metagenome]